MGYPHRVVGEGLTYHLIARGNNRRDVFPDDEGRSQFVGLLVEVARRYLWQVLAYCVMTNHFHIVATTPEANLSSGMQTLMSRYARDQNRRQGRTGHVFGRRFWSHPIADDDHLANVIRYVLRNPVAAGLVTAGIDWPASSCRLTLDANAEVPAELDVEFVLGMFHRNPQHARSVLRAFIEDDPGPSAFVVGDQHPKAPPLRPTLFQLLGALDHERGVREALARGYGRVEIARALGVSRSAVRSRIARTSASQVAPSLPSPMYVCSIPAPRRRG
jgi:REP element-mobilizing transposase RayT